MQKVIKYLLYFIITIKVLFILSIIRNTLNGKIISNTKVKKKIKKRKEIFHETFLFLTYVLLILLFNPFQKNIKLNENPTESRHLQIVIFALGIIQLINFDYTLIYMAPQEFINSL